MLMVSKVGIEITSFNAWIFQIYANVPPHMVSKLAHSKSSQIVRKKPYPSIPINIGIIRPWEPNNLDTIPIIPKDLVENGPKFDLRWHHLQSTTTHEFDDIQHHISPDNYYKYVDWTYAELWLTILAPFCEEMTSFFQDTKFDSLHLVIMTTSSDQQASITPKLQNIFSTRVHINNILLDQLGIKTLFL